MKHSMLILFAFFVSNSLALDNGVAVTPPMGWLTWQRFRCNTDCENDPNNCISENLIKVMADHMHSDGYVAAGYEYIIVDDCWPSHQRDSQNRLVPDPIRFPSGIRALADYVHSKGLKFGIYADYGTLTCGGYPGSLNYLEIDAQTFANWTVDYLKLDGCYSDVKTMDDGYPQMTQFLNQTGRPIVFSCSWPAYQVFDNIDPNYMRIAEFCNLWRNYGDIDDSWDSVKSIVEWYSQKQDNLSLAHGPGHWNDPDMLLIGNFGLSKYQSETQMALWSILSAPLIMSVDLRVIEPWARDILQNHNLLAVNQDRLGIMGRKFNVQGNVEMWTKPIVNDRTVFVFMYPLPYGEPARQTVSLKDLGLIRYQRYDFYNLFDGTLIGSFNYDDSFAYRVNPSGSSFSFWAQATPQIDGIYVEPLPVMTLATLF